MLRGYPLVKRTKESRSVSFVGKLSLSQRVFYRRFRCNYFAIVLTTCEPPNMDTFGCIGTKYSVLIKQDVLISGCLYRGFNVIGLMGHAVVMFSLLIAG